MSLLWIHAAGTLPKGLTFQHYAPDPKHLPWHDDFDGDWDEADHEGVHQFSAHLPNGDMVGNLELRGVPWEDEEKGVVRPEGEILGVEVHPAYQRRGIARALVEHARSLGFEVHHSPTRSDDGEAWSHAVDPGHGVPRWDEDEDHEWDE